MRTGRADAVGKESDGIRVREPLPHCAPTNRGASSHAFPLVHQLKPDFTAAISRRIPLEWSSQRARKRALKVAYEVSAVFGEKTHVSRDPSGESSSSSSFISGEREAVRHYNSVKPREYKAITKFPTSSPSTTDPYTRLSESLFVLCF